MTVEELQSVIVYLQDKIEKLEAKKMCECAVEEPPEDHTKPTVTYKATPREVFVTNYDEDEECISCSAQLPLSTYLQTEPYTSSVSPFT